MCDHLQFNELPTRFSHRLNKFIKEEQYLPGMAWYGKKYFFKDFESKTPAKCYNIVIQHIQHLFYNSVDRAGG